ncbi:hypothetical protein HW561_16830 [Rhodobacteraceae bacterium B1Z28]|uniref:Tetratricopeptide repeat protein n=1 Tax=Ruegeria haliotis TaxID=2747601 RepID=A0ABX2PTH0_9RHOB|nr:hypothetical protein [Ruegeria haliotis]NVO57463.1 hypothetical protein [Ruegeria haliotis]
MAALHTSAINAQVELQPEMNDWDGALESLNAFIAFDPDDNRHWAKRGQVLEELGRPDDALTNY